MKRNNNYQCSNIANETYTGKECSPKGLGFSAVPYDIGFEKQGADNQIWVVQIKNGKKVWFRKSGMPSINITHEEPLITNTSITNDINESISINDTVNISDNTISINETITKKEEEQKVQQAEKKKTNYTLFQSYYLNKLKQENIEKKLNKKPKDMCNETNAEWNRIKNNKKELEEILIIIKK